LAVRDEELAMSGSAVIMARIVDAAGKPLRPTAVESLNYSMAGDERQPLRAHDVLLDSLERNGVWTVDREGYNFRHEIELGRTDEAAKSGNRHEIRYELTPIGGPMTLMRFQIGVTQA
jgi:hypothetical protein